MTPHRLGSTMRVLHPAPNVLAFYDGRIEGVRAWSDAPNWLDDGAYALGTCSYAIVDGAEALVYDTHMSVPHADIVRQVLEANGVRSMRVVLSHWHVDHVAGNATFQDCEIIANTLTAESLVARKAALESDTPPIRPLIGPTRTFETRLDLRVGSIAVELHRFDIHSRDGTIMVLPEAGLLFAGDTLEDPVTYVVEPDRLEHHLIDLDRLSGLIFARILPNHGAVAQIEGGGYDRSLIDATRHYVEKLIRCRDEPELAHQDLRTFIGPDLEAGNVQYWAAYEAVHRANIARVSSRKPDA